MAEKLLAEKFPHTIHHIVGDIFRLDFDTDVPDDIAT